MTFTDIKDNPGLYPLNLGKTIVKYSEWTVFKIVDYEPLLVSYKLIREDILNVISRISNISYIIEHRQSQYVDITINHNNQLLMIKQYLGKTDKLINQLFPHISYRFKEALQMV